MSTDRKTAMPSKEEFREAALAMGAAPDAKFADDMYDLMNGGMSDEEFDEALDKVVMERLR